MVGSRACTYPGPRACMWAVDLSTCKCCTATPSPFYQFPFNIFFYQLLRQGFSNSLFLAGDFVGGIPGGGFSFSNSVLVVIFYANSCFFELTFIISFFGLVVFRGEITGGRFTCNSNELPLAIQIKYRF
jgi:hypothetical protein